MFEKLKVGIIHILLIFQKEVLFLLGLLCRQFLAYFFKLDEV